MTKVLRIKKHEPPKCEQCGQVADHYISYTDTSTAHTHRYPDGRVVIEAQRSAWSCEACIIASVVKMVISLDLKQQNNEEQTNA